MSKSLKQRIVETLRPLAERAFCPTGEGGGIDNSCGREGGNQGSGSKFKDESMPFGDWEAPTRDAGIYGYRGIGSGGSFGNSEGDGMYIAKNSDTAAFFGKVQRITFIPPKNPFLVDEEPLYILMESEELEEPLSKKDSAWLSVCKKSFQAAMKKKGKWDVEEIGHQLTNILKKQGHDGIRVRSGNEEWVVLYDNAPKSPEK